MLRLPSTPPADVPALYACMDVFVAPYLRDTFAVANIEAMAMEVPFVHFGLGGLQDYAVHMVNSVRVESLGPDGLADAMLMLARDPALRHSLGAAGRRLAQRQYAYPDMEMRAAQTFR
jgi:glycosyltransferase involved in cell wall biosynthesis